MAKLRTLTGGNLRRGAVGLPEVPNTIETDPAIAAVAGLSQAAGVFGNVTLNEEEARIKEGFIDREKQKREQEAAAKRLKAIEDATFASTQRVEFGNRIKEINERLERKLDGESNFAVRSEKIAKEYNTLRGEVSKMDLPPELRGQLDNLITQNEGTQTVGHRRNAHVAAQQRWVNASDKGVQTVLNAPTILSTPEDLKEQLAQADGILAEGVQAGVISENFAAAKSDKYRASLAGQYLNNVQESQGIDAVIDELKNNKDIKKALGVQAVRELTKKAERAQKDEVVVANNRFMKNATSSIEFRLSEGSSPEVFKGLVLHDLGIEMGELTPDEKTMLTGSIIQQLQVELKGRGDAANMERVESLETFIQGNTAVERSMRNQIDVFKQSFIPQLNAEQKAVKGYADLLATGDTSKPLVRTPDIANAAYNTFRKSGMDMAHWTANIAHFNSSNPDGKAYYSQDFLKELDMVAASDPRSFMRAIAPVLALQPDAAYRMVGNLKNNSHVAGAMLTAMAMGQDISDRVANPEYQDVLKKSIIRIKQGLPKVNENDKNETMEIGREKALQKVVLNNSRLFTDEQKAMFTHLPPALSSRQIAEFDNMMAIEMADELNVNRPREGEHAASDMRQVMKDARAKVAKDFLIERYKPVANIVVHAGHRQESVTYSATTKLLDAGLNIPSPVLAEIRKGLPDLLKGTRTVERKAVSDKGLLDEANFMLVPGGLGASHRVERNFLFSGPRMEARTDHIRQEKPGVWSFPVVNSDTGSIYRAVEIKVGNDGKAEMRLRDDSKSKALFSEVNRDEFRQLGFIRYNASKYGNFTSYKEYMQSLNGEDLQQAQEEVRAVLSVARGMTKKDPNSKAGQAEVQDFVNGIFRSSDWPNGFNLNDRPDSTTTDAGAGQAD